MLGYICKYTPVEAFISMGVEMKRVEPDVTNFNQADMKMHPNICSFAKGVLEEMMKEDYEGIILTTCCDSIRRLYDVLKGKSVVMAVGLIILIRMFVPYWTLEDRTVRQSL